MFQVMRIETDKEKPSRNPDFLCDLSSSIGGISAGIVAVAQERCTAVIDTEKRRIDAATGYTGVDHR